MDYSKHTAIKNSVRATLSRSGMSSALGKCYTEKRKSADVSNVFGRQLKFSFWPKDAKTTAVKVLAVLNPELAKYGCRAVIDDIKTSVNWRYITYLRIQRTAPLNDVTLPEVKPTAVIDSWAYEMFDCVNNVLKKPELIQSMLRSDGLAVPFQKAHQICQAFVDHGYAANCPYSGTMVKCCKITDKYNMLRGVFAEFFSNTEPALFTFFDYNN